MRKLILLTLFISLSAGSGNAFAFGWFGLLDANVIHLHEQTYQLRVTVRYGGDWLGSPTDEDVSNGRYFHDYGPDPGGMGPVLSSFSLGALGNHQHNSFPYLGYGYNNPSAAPNLWYSAVGNHGWLNQGLPNTFGYDFDFTGSSQRYFDLSYHADLGWFWGVGTYSEQHEGTVRAYVVPESPTGTLLFIALLGFVSFGYVCRRAVTARAS